MPVVAVAVCPHPPLLLPDIAGDAAFELDDLRSACELAVRRMLDAGPAAVAVVSGAETMRRYPPGSTGDFREFGAPWALVGFGTPDPAVTDRMPVGHLVGAWLLERSGTGCTRYGYGVAPDATPPECAELGRRLAASDSPVGLLVLGDGSARRTEKAPGYFHPDAERFDAAVADALGGADTGALLAIDPAQAADLMVAGRAPWQVLAAATGGTAWRSELLYHAAPYGVGYFVASWLR